mmetsp:Transcript_102237/g.329874  ORF Transcript_102237/g.329874 Transcript_102237/m.329874 type:complete len:234 (+) Transcript_102237:46-747(+)
MLPNNCLLLTRYVSSCIGVAPPAKSRLLPADSQASTSCQSHRPCALCTEPLRRPTLRLCQADHSSEAGPSNRRCARGWKMWREPVHRPTSRMMGKPKRLLLQQLPFHLLAKRWSRRLGCRHLGETWWQHRRGTNLLQTGVLDLCSDPVSSESEQSYPPRVPSCPASTICRNHHPTEPSTGPLTPPTAQRCRAGRSTVAGPSSRRCAHGLMGPILSNPRSGLQLIRHLPSNLYR